MLIFDATNLDRRLCLAYELKEAFRAAMAIGKCGDEENFTIAIDMFVTWCATQGSWPLSPWPTRSRPGDARS